MQNGYESGVEWSQDGNFYRAWARQEQSPSGAPIWRGAFQIEEGVLVAPLLEIALAFYPTEDCALRAAREVMATYWKLSRTLDGKRFSGNPKEASPPKI